VAKPLRGLDEKGMMDLLRGREDLRVGMVALSELGAARLTAKDQVWVEAGLAASPGPVLDELRRTSARVVLYARPGALPASLAGLPLRRGTFSPAAEARPARAAADVFPSGVVRLRSISEGSLEAPLAEAPWREAAVLAEGGRKGLLMGWFPLGGGKQALFLVLPPLWDLLFDPQADFAAREALEGLLTATWALAEREEGAFKVLRPRVAYSNLPFDLEFTLPGPAARQAGDLELRAREAGGRTERLELEAAAGGAYRARNISLPAGAWMLEMARGGEVSWRDSLPVQPRAALELSRIGFDRASLLAIAAASGGRVLEPDAAARVTSMLPDPRGSQIKVERTTAIRLYNTRLLFLLAVALLAASWLLRKRWDLD
ncbi:MAG TPA: hypothetical protein VK465_13825, partial [Fibrobacteria bacterium]|nr:hypothetical protein [Fibrobacteria bacterium]